MWEAKKKKRAAEYRALADHTRRVAAQMSLAKERDHLIGTAQRLESLAEAAERERDCAAAEPALGAIDGPAGD